MAEEENAETVVEAESTGDLSLSEMFTESEPEKPEVEAQPEPEDKGEPEPEKPKEEAIPEAEPEKEAEPPSAEQGQLAALLAERDKRQKAENRVKELESKIEPEAKADPIEDPDGFREELAKETAAAALKTRIEMSQTMMTELDPDYPRLEEVFKGLIADEDGTITDEGLLRKFQNSANPAKFARDHAKQHEEIEAMKDPKYRENLEAEIRAKVLAEIADAGVSAADVPDLTTASAAGSNSDKPPEETSIAGMFDGA